MSDFMSLSSPEKSPVMVDCPSRILKDTVGPEDKAEDKNGFNSGHNTENIRSGMDSPDRFFHFIRPVEVTGLTVSFSDFFFFASAHGCVPPDTVYTAPSRYGLVSMSHFCP